MTGRCVKNITKDKAFCWIIKNVCGIVVAAKDNIKQRRGKYEDKRKKELYPNVQIQVISQTIKRGHCSRLFL